MSESSLSVGKDNMPRGYISIGSNIDKEAHIPCCLNTLEKLFGPLVTSSIYESEAVGFVGGMFHNLIVGFNSELTARQVAQILRQIELEHGRSRQSQKFSSRTLDLDLILYGDEILQDDGLILPRPEIEQYAFVLEPLSEIAGSLKHPVSGKTYSQLWQEANHIQGKQNKIIPVWQSDR